MADIRLGLVCVVLLLCGLSPAVAQDDQPAPTPPAAEIAAEPDTMPAAEPTKPAAERTGKPAANPGAKPAAKPEGGGGLFGDTSIVFPILLIIGVFYFMILRPDMQKQKEAQKRLSELKKNDAIVTVGGICGTVVNISSDSKYLTIRIDDGNNTKMRILRSAVGGFDTPADSSQNAS